VGISLGVVFDLDDTLYLERDYVRSGFAAVAVAVSDAAGEVPATISGLLWEAFETDERRGSIDRLLQHFPKLADQYPLPALLRIYRYHRPEISLLSGMHELMVKLRNEGMRLGLLTDGERARQELKLTALSVDDLFDLRIFTDDWGRDHWKPHPRGFEAIERSWHLAPARLVYVGDNPVKDFAAPRARGWQTIRIRTPGQITAHLEATTDQVAAACEVDGPVALMTALRTAEDPT
jgi:putative hydrolase of the HAD superfamily